MNGPAEKTAWRRRLVPAVLCIVLFPPVLFLAMEGPVLYFGTPDVYNTVYSPVWKMLDPVMPYDVKLVHFRYAHWWMDRANERR
jgi:hypothetical protein